MQRSFISLKTLGQTRHKPPHGVRHPKQHYQLPSIHGRAVTPDDYGQAAIAWVNRNIGAPLFDFAVEAIMQLAISLPEYLGRRSIIKSAPPAQ